MTKPGSLAFYSIVCFLAIFLQSCEGFKILTVRNNTTETIRIHVNYETPRPGDRADGKPQPFTKSENYLVMPDSSLGFRSHFTGLLFNRKFREGELAIDYLSMATPGDTIVAKNKKEIIELINNSPGTENQAANKKHVIGDKRNIITIVAK